MATSSTDYSSKAGNVGTYRLKLNITCTSQSTSGNTSTVRIRAWIQSFNNSSFSITSTYEGRFNGTELVSNTKGMNCSGNGELLVFDYTRTVTHDSNGNATATATANFENSLTGYHAVKSVLKLNRIPQYPDAPSSAPKFTRSGTTVKITSGTADGNGGSILGYQIQRRRYSGGAWLSWATTDGKTVTFDGIAGADYQARSRAQTSRGWGDYSATESFTMPADTSGVGSVDIELAAGTVKAVWEPPPSMTNLTGYNVYLHNGTSWSSGVGVAASATSYSFTSLSVGTYMVGVEAVYTSSTSPRVESDAAYLGTVPGTIGSVALSAEGSATWAAPSTGGSAILGYDVEWWSGTAWGDAETTTQLTAAYDPDPLPGIGYRSRVRAVNAIGPGAWQTSAYKCLTECGCTI